MKCVIIEDQPPAQRILQKYISEIGYLKLEGVFSNAIEALAFLKTHPVDLIFLDIHLPKISGIEFLKVLDPRPSVILTTAFSEYALESYDYGVKDYLLKPFSFERFVKALAKIPDPSAGQKEEFEAKNKPEARKEIFIKSGYEHIRIKVKDIIYIKSDGDYTEIVLQEKKHLSSESLRFWLENLKDKEFVRTHKSYIINTSKIQKIVGNQLTLEGGKKTPIGRAYKEQFIKGIIK
ncbi:LytR/AlgR family response regulator transcription factor [Eudoraea chungangensis]|uniref:LytR/AlgR family response regulator transcription factor n=1 Tax=Eudoraea chungangensis TaxID=1481905 RepID=UPI0023ED26C5|nr:LytTR family DNA-binding domain-containing protein [Eudoraea chungangensis]